MNSLLDIFLPYQKKFFLNNKKRKIFLSSRQIGKSFTAANILVYKALSRKNGTSLCVSVNQNSASEIIKKCIQVAEAVKLLSNGAITYSASFDKVVFSNGSRVISLSSNPAAMRGYSTCCCVIDEAAYVEHLDDVLQAIAPTLTRDNTAELIVLTTPAGRNGCFYDMYMNALANEKEWYVQTTTIYDAIKDGLKVDINSLKTLCPDDDIFQQEYCCKFATTSTALIDLRHVNVYDTLQTNIVQTYIGVDFGRTNDFTAISVIGKGFDDKLYLIDLEVMKNESFSNQMDRIKYFFNKYSPKVLYGDAGGIGKPLMEDLEINFNSRCKPFVFTNLNKHDLYTYFKKVCLNNELFIDKRFNDAILEDISLVNQVVTDSGKIIYSSKRSSNSGHGDRLSSILLALQGCKEHININQLPMGVMRRSRL